MMSSTAVDAGTGIRRGHRSPDVVRLVLVDDHAMLREGLRSVLEREDDLAVVGEAGSQAEAEAVIRAVSPDVVVLDLKLSAGSDYDGLSLCAEILSIPVDE